LNEEIMTHRIGNKNMPETTINNIYFNTLFIGIFLLLNAELKSREYSNDNEKNY